jgi:hypothetical protein
VNTRELAAHGTYARANGSPRYRPPCPCDKCRPVRRAVKKRLTVNRQLGKPGLVDATPARQRLLKLHETADWVAIAASIGTHSSVVRLIANGTKHQIRRTTHEKIMTARPAPGPGHNLDATGTRRRIQALVAIGHTYRSIARTAGCSFRRLQAICDGQTTVRQALADKVAKAYREMSDTPGPDTRARNRAAANDWPPPAAWDDDTIDDPAAEADLGDTVPRFIALAEDALWLIDTQGYTRATAAERLGTTRGNIDAAINRWRTRNLTQHDTEAAA